ncbi:MAG TPA: Hpt domain-containing protein, partial [Polyangiaceae bacterium]|nr:Hpt domain-containing protein [Polyangiaceae bacterium]
MSHELGDKGREDFLSEAQEVIDRLSRDLLLLDATTRVGPVDADLVNSVFRGVHTLKGLCGMFNATHLTALSHELENTLDELRLGKTNLTPELLDQLFRAIEIYNRLLAVSRTMGADEPDEELEAFLRDLRRIGGPASVSSSGGTVYDLDANLLAVLTEYEEHRLRSSVDSGLRLYRIRVAFQLVTIDEQLEAIKGQLKPYGEILTYLPTGGAVSADSIELEILLASGFEVEKLQQALSSVGGTVEEMPKIRVASGASPTGSPSLDSQALADAVPSRGGPSVSLPTRMTLSPQEKILKTVYSVAKPEIRAEATLRSVAQTVRVDIARLDQLMNLVGELAIVRGGLERVVEQIRSEPSLRSLARDLGRLHHGFERHLASMQAAILEVRMVPLGQVFEKLARVARQASREVHKEVNLVITGAETEVDKLIGEELSDPLMHIIRNALDHGIEDGDARERVGKPRTGTIALNAYAKGNQVVVEVEDDGAGIDADELVRSAVGHGLLTAEEANELTDRDRVELVFLPGLSTRSEPGRLSGRGVGMDVVKTNIGRLGGVVDVQSEKGIG